jgi:phenylpropionate dioxygenase-like ring-hydroxylating dioxygenase large terminal subunit
MIPSLNPDQELDLNLFGVRCYPIEESQGNIWIYMTQQERGTPTPPQMPAPGIPGFSGQKYQALVQKIFPCALDHAVAGLVDPTHVSFVHRSWWWRGGVELSEEIKTFDPCPYGFTMRRHRLERQTFFYRLLGGEAEVEISFQLPSIRIEQVTTRKHRVTNLTVMTPISETETEVTNALYTTLPWVKPLLPVLYPFIHTFLNQDRDISIKQSVGLSYSPPLTLVKEADAQIRWYLQLRAEFAKAAEQKREFVNPLKTQVLRWRA